MLLEQKKTRSKKNVPVRFVRHFLAARDSVIENDTTDNTPSFTHYLIFGNQQKMIAKMPIISKPNFVEPKQN